MRTLFTVKHRLNNTANDSERKKAVTVEDTVNVVGLTLCTRQSCFTHHYPSRD